MNCLFSIPMEEYTSRQGLDKFDSPRVTIESLPVDVLLDIFYFYQREHGYGLHRWHVLVHVCQRWRHIVFAFPHCLGLYLECTEKTPVRRTLDAWPCLPIIIRDTWKCARKWPVLIGDNIIAALEHHDRICEIELYLLCPLLEQFSRAMQVPFPALTLLKLDLADKSVPALVVPDTFLGGSASRLQRLILSGIPFPTLPKILQSSHNLVEIRLTRIPNIGYISPKSMATALSALSKLEVLEIGFESPASRTDRHALPSTRVNLPSLTRMEFHGASEYFEDFIARIDTPSIRYVKTMFFNQLVFDNPRFLQFVGRTKSLRSFKRADLFLDNSTAKILHYDDRLDSPRKPVSLHIRILCNALDWKLSGLAQICAELSIFLSNVERCNVEWNRNWTVPLEDMDHTQWLELFRPFTSVQSLEISSGLEGLIAPALKELTGVRVMEVFPVLRTLTFSQLNSEPKSPNPFEQFIRGHKLTNYPVDRVGSAASQGLSRANAFRSHVGMGIKRQAGQDSQKVKCS
ncbi:hypothetical protein BGW80DRAFT_82958 [Lactifluus volemus]|nr:hypothetical protein BGW80DRAFT_82958 [Lactifluus volemus]